ncbi:MAG: L-aspartate oxidase [Proteobacteria bacterium]|nr:L-aspartate oxidase [Pseudomonadota bacterium]
MSQGGIVIIGAGIAGLSTALRLAPAKVTVLAGAPLGEGSATAWAQGGIASAIGPEDRPEFHAEDTVKAGAGLVDPKRALHLAQKAPGQITWLQKLGVEFDVDSHGQLALGREAAHGKHRIVHAGGDGTGAAVMQALIRLAQKTPSIHILTGWFAQDLRVENGAVTGIVLVNGVRRAVLSAEAVVLATGGIGQIYACTTNPGAACGDGLAMAARAGAEMADLEFVQFHPTALDIGKDPMPLLTEALRGDGAILVNSEGERFMRSEHELAELAPRDVVARAIWRQLQEGLRPVLDARECFASRAPDKFPLIREICLQAGIDPAHQPLPLAPAAHYHMGGVVVDEKGRSTLKGLWVCGEAACAFIHGANRLASNSLLEALVYSQNIAEDLAGKVFTGPPSLRQMPDIPNPDVENEKELRVELRRLMYDRLGLVREKEGMTEALKRFAEIASTLSPHTRLSSQLLVAGMITTCALMRLESRGAHFRLDYPKTSSIAKHTRLTFSSFRKNAASYLDAAWPVENAA